MTANRLTWALLIWVYPGETTIHDRTMMLFVLDYEPPVAIPEAAAENDGFQIR